MKRDKEWLKEKVKEEYEYNRAKYNKEGFEGYAHREFVFKYVLGLINQLDEPEVLSQELPVIPQFVADWLDDNIERYDTVYSFIISLVEVFGDTVPEKVWTYSSENADTMARAYLDGYTVEEEQKYYVLDTEDIPLLERANNQTYKTTTTLSIYEDGRDNSKFKLTEQEIKDYDERMWAFAEEVTHD